MQTARFLAVLAPMLVSLSSGYAQDQVKFEVASIKANTSGPQTGFSIDFTPEGRLNARNTTVWNLIREAYRLRDLQISGGPGWIKNEGFDVEARPASPVSRDKMDEMLRS